jgi:Holliday junction resolvasome RuvABC endonuclease subunit
MGIDPGSRITGYGIIDMEGPRSRLRRQRRYSDRQ